MRSYLALDVTVWTITSLSKSWWQAVEGLAEGFSLQDYDKMASALVRYPPTQPRLPNLSLLVEIWEPPEELALVPLRPPRVLARCCRAHHFAATGAFTITVYINDAY